MRRSCAPGSPLGRLDGGGNLVTMPWYKIEFRGDGLERAMASLNEMSIATIGPPFTRVGEEGVWHVGHQISVNSSSASSAAALNVPRERFCGARPNRLVVAALLLHP